MIHTTLDFTDEEREIFTKTEWKILLLVRQHKIEDEDRIRHILDFPLTMEKSTYRVHKARLMKKVAQIRLARTNLDSQE